MPTVTLNEYNRLVEKSKGLDEFLHGLKCLAGSEAQLKKLKSSGRIPRDILRTLERERGMIRVETFKKLAHVLNLVAAGVSEQADILDAIELVVGETRIAPSPLGPAYAREEDEDVDEDVFDVHPDDAGWIEPPNHNRAFNQAIERLLNQAPIDMGGTTTYTLPRIGG